MAERTDDMGFGGLRLIQDTEEFCYGIDAVLAAGFAARNRHEKIIDLGTNNGVIPLILSRISSAEFIAGAEKQRRGFELAVRNAQLNGLQDRLEFKLCDILDIAEHYKKGSFDAVVCNPPYFEKSTGIINDSKGLAAARHETTARLEDFIKCAAYLLMDKGAFYMIHRPSRIVDIAWHCRNNGLEPKYMRFVSPKEGVKPNLILVECRKNGGRELKFMDPLIVYDSKGNYTKEILEIYRKE